MSSTSIHSDTPIEPVPISSEGKEEPANAKLATTSNTEPEEPQPLYTSQWETVEAVAMPNHFKGLAAMTCTAYQKKGVSSYVVVYGGASSGLTSHALSSLFVIDTLSSEWKLVPKSIEGITNASPPSIQWHSASLVGDDIYFIFGRSHFLRWYCSNTVFVISGAELGNSTVNWSQPKIEYPDGHIPCRYAHSASVVNSKIYIFGGTDGVRHFNDLSVLDTTTKVWRKLYIPDGPSARMGHTGTSYNQYIVVFGGYGIQLPKFEKHTNSVVIFDTVSSTWFVPKVSGPLPQGRIGHSATLVEDKIVIFGGLATNKIGDRSVMQDVWILDLSKIESQEVSWISLPTSGVMNPRYLHDTVFLNKSTEGTYTLLTFGGGSDPQISFSPTQFLPSLSLLHIAYTNTEKKGTTLLEQLTAQVPETVALNPAQRVSNEIRRQAIQPLELSDIEWSLIFVNIILGVLLYATLPFITPIVYSVLSFFAFVGGLMSCILIVTLGMFAVRYRQQLSQLDNVAKHFYDVYNESEGSRWAIISDVIRGGLSKPQTGNGT